MVNCEKRHLPEFLIPSNSMELKPESVRPPNFNYGESATIAKPLEFERFETGLAHGIFVTR